MAKVINNKVPPNPNVSTINQSLEVCTHGLICIHFTIKMFLTISTKVEKILP